MQTAHLADSRGRMVGNERLGATQIDTHLVMATITLHQQNRPMKTDQYGLSLKITAVLLEEIPEIDLLTLAVIVENDHLTDLAVIAGLMRRAETLRASTVRAPVVKNMNTVGQLLRSPIMVV